MERVRDKKDNKIGMARMADENMIKKVILTREGRRIFVNDENRDFHTQFGFVKKKDLKGKDKLAKTNKGEKVAILNPRFIDLFSRIKRHAQIITPKDVGIIIANTGINKDSAVVDLGSGTGALACFLANIAKRVVTYDIDDRSIKTVEQNIALLGLSNITVKKKDCYKHNAISERNADIVTIDLTEPWRALGNAKKALKTGGFAVSYSPHITQSKTFAETAAKKGFIVLKTAELLERDWVLDEKKARPGFHGLSHTGFLTFLRKFE